MNLHPSNTDMKCHHSMHHAAENFIAGNDHYSLVELAAGHLIIRVPEKDQKAASKALKSVTKLTFPDTLSVQSNDNYSIYWIAPDEFLLLVPEHSEFEVETKLRKAMKGHFAIVNVTGGQTIIHLSGERAESIMKKSTVYDIHERNLPVGKAVTSGFAKSQAIFNRTGDNSFQLIVRRSFSDYIWQWIVDAGSRP